MNSSVLLRTNRFCFRLIFLYVFFRGEIYLPCFNRKGQTKYKSLAKGPYIKYEEERGEREEGRWRRAFVGAMKYCRLTLMGHEIFFKIFDGPRNIVACSIFIILFFKLKG